MMIKSDIRILGDNKIIGYQRFVLIIGILLFLIFSIISFMNWDLHYFIATVIIALFFALLLTVYSKIYAIEYDKSYFYLNNMFSKQKKKSDCFSEIRHVKTAPFLYVACFKDKKYYFLVSSHEYYKTLFKSKKNNAIELSETIKEFIVL